MTVYLLETKTSGEDISPGSMYWRKLLLDNQVSMYINAFRQQGMDVAGVVYDVIGKTRLRPGKGETPESYEARITAQIGEQPDRYYQRGIITRTDAELAEHQWDIWMTADSIARAAELEWYPRNVGNCVRYNRPCDYWAVCSGETTIDGPHYERREPSGKRLPMLSDSAIRTWRTCPREYQYAYVMRMRRTVAAADARGFGSAVHKATEALHKQEPGAAIAYLNAIQDPYERAHGRALIRGYAARWERSAYRVTETEREWSSDLLHPVTGEAHDKFELGGRMDGVVEVAT